MRRSRRPFGNDIFPIKSDGTKLDRSGVEPSLTGYTLASGQTYYYPVDHGTADCGNVAIHVKWDNAAILTITVEDTCFTDVLGYSTTAGEWEKENNTSAYVAADGGATVTAMTVTVPGGTAGGCLFNLGFLGSMRCRLKIVVGGTGGVVRVAANQKD